MKLTLVPICDCSCTSQVVHCTYKWMIYTCILEQNVVDFVSECSSWTKPSSQWRIQGGGGPGGLGPPFSQRTRSRVARAWLHAILCALARARVSAFYNGGSCTRAMKKRDIRNLTSVSKQGRRNQSGWSGQSRTTLQRSSNQYS